MVPMVVEVGGEPPPTPLSNFFEKLVTAQSKRVAKGAPSKFIKWIEDILVVALSPEDTIRVEISLADQALIGKFIELYPSPKTTKKWVQRNWRPPISKNVASYSVGRGYFLFDFEYKDDKYLVFRNGP